MLTALSLPAILLVGLGAVQLQSVFTDRGRTQDVADATALWGAQQMTITPIGADQRAIAYADAQLVNVKANAEVTVSATAVGVSGMKVTIDTHRPSFFLNLMPLGGFFTHAEATAEGVSQTPLCVITFGRGKDDMLELTKEGRLSAPACLIHANQGVKVAGAALLQARTIETGKAASGPMVPTASTGAPDVEDPFASVDLTQGGALQCASDGPKQDIASNATLAPGAHCGDVEVADDKVLTLAPGNHFFRKRLELKKNAGLVGKDVVIVFGKDGEPRCQDSASVTLSGRETGGLAGFIVAASRNRTKELKLDSDSITDMTGTVYVPAATLNITGNKKTAQASDWTVMAAMSLRLSEKPQVQINSDYYGSSVPVPFGVGNKANTAFTRRTQ